ncbi:MAG: putative toxin-antitoxin system toxin component, PIN family [Planctomycetales bacterium]|nr:putative toxin-antitoxin system toxin component, PIN family [Planctomycetales bacterium]NIM09301.1 putative toxin-antitoxin system toxin component, PIN family [Planctomycetales bacterium]NIN08769.1 putative toxin-antitoxin system toxin component, PIN family [Planctomycetales bacterium]NIN77886.1 putative toxin-antitoxin system toxin component, PIN family [Planctomycetales bacterium]NIO35069.1 putative toxin-antitoxin system toxin component, PIN family [Planctomycetales bacterium]
MPCIVLDTNVLIAAARAPRSASRKIVTACLAGQAVAAVSQAVRGEYQLIVRQALSRVPYCEQLQQFIECCLPVEPDSVPRAVPDDAEDDKLVALAIAAKADMLISSDKHLTSLGRAGEIPILTPSAALARLQPPLC